MSLLRRLTFNLWYFRNPPWDRGISPPELFEFIRTHPAGRAIDLGCGTGTNVITLAQAGWQATGIDFASRAIQRAKQKIKNANVQADVQVGDVTNLHNVRGPFNLALDMGCFHSLDHRTAYLDQLTRLLTPGGFWLLYAFINPAPDLAGPGLGAPDFEMISSRGLKLIARQDGVDRRERPSAWFQFQKL